MMTEIVKKILGFFACCAVATVSNSAAMLDPDYESKGPAAQETIVTSSIAPELEKFKDKTRVLMRHIELVAWQMLEKSTKQEGLAARIIAEATKDSKNKKDWHAELDKIADKDFVKKVTALEEEAKKTHLGEAITSEQGAEDAVRAYTSMVRNGVEKLVKEHKAPLKKALEVPEIPERRSSESVAGREIDAEVFFRSGDTDTE